MTLLQEQCKQNSNDECLACKAILKEVLLVIEEALLMLPFLLLVLIGRVRSLLGLFLLGLAFAMLNLALAFAPILSCQGFLIGILVPPVSSFLLQ